MTLSPLVSEARAFALEALKDEVRGNGHPFIEHPDAVAEIVAEEIGLGDDCLAAIYLHEASRKHPEADLSAFPQEVRVLAEGLNMISSIRPKDTQLEAENYKRLIVRCSPDPRTTVIKIADRLEIMRNLSLFSKVAREQKLLETLLLYIPLAHQLGLYNIKSELEDIWFRYADPQSWRAITNKLKATEADRERLSREFVQPLAQKLSAVGIQYKLKVRTKTAYSIYRKMKAQGVPFEGVYDVFAMRFIIDCEESREKELDLCWKVYSYVTEEYEPDTTRLRDWLTNPKPNGYESLHITVKNKQGNFIEVQIRTKRMDDIAENGLASHWSYKGVKGQKTLDAWLATVRYRLEHPLEELEPDALPGAPVGEIFVFTPSGELKILREGASVLDFAFSIHSGLGCRCIGGRINGKQVTLREKLKTGDVVEILSSKNQKPGKDWLGWVVTSKAKSKIKQELDAEERKKAADGRELLERRLKNWKLEFSDEMRTALMKQRKYPTQMAMMAAIAEGELDVNEIKSFILSAQERTEAVEEGPKTPTLPSALQGGSDDILVLGARDVKGIDYKMAHCCNPVYGDDVFGFVTRTEGIKIHRMSCPNATRLLERYPYRIQRVVWQDSAASGNFQCTLMVSADSDNAALADIMEVIGQFKVSLRSFNVNPNRRGGTFEIAIRLLVPSNMELDKVISRISALRQVEKVKRV